MNSSVQFISILSFGDSDVLVVDELHCNASPNCSNRYIEVQVIIVTAIV